MEFPVWKADCWSSVVLLILGAVIGIESVSLGLGTWKAPGPGFLPFAAGLILLSLSMAIIAVAYLKGRKSPEISEKLWPPKENLKAIFAVLMSLVVYDLFWNILGFTLSTFLLLGFLYRYVGKRKWGIVIVGATLTAFVTYMLFGVLLKVQLPTGVVGF